MLDDDYPQTSQSHVARKKSTELTKVVLPLGRPLPPVVVALLELALRFHRPRKTGA